MSQSTTQLDEKLAALSVNDAADGDSAASGSEYAEDLDGAGAEAAADEDENDDLDPETRLLRRLPKLTVPQIKAELAKFGLSKAGNKEKCRSRLREHLRTVLNNRATEARKAAAMAAIAERIAAAEMEKQKLKAKPEPEPPKPAAEERGQVILVIDVEATCVEDGGFAYRNEIIEFPCVALDGKGNQLAEFHSYVRPTLNPTLSEYCTGLTGVTQADVDAAPTWPEVLSAFQAWLIAHDLVQPLAFTSDVEYGQLDATAALAVTNERKRVLVATDGPWDVRDFVRKSCDLHTVPAPFYLTRFLDLRKYVKRTVVPTEQQRRAPTRPGEAPLPPPATVFVGKKPYEGGNLESLLEFFGLTFEGRPHCGRDDTRNIARVVQALVRLGYVLGYNWQRVRKSNDPVAQLATGKDKSDGRPTTRGWACGDEQWVWMDLGPDGKLVAPAQNNKPRSGSAGFKKKYY
ncbi:hypothetical protein H9P43_000575 [Blastocladiella emersonii ATCC 22665]|nr:hypothetical protein H9P43_000575 [Blastocladiella emersonii ATCC 22665]